MLDLVAFINSSTTECDSITNCIIITFPIQSASHFFLFLPQSSIRKAGFSSKNGDSVWLSDRVTVKNALQGVYIHPAVCGPEGSGGAAGETRNTDFLQFREASCLMPEFY